MLVATLQQTCSSSRELHMCELHPMNQSQPTHIVANKFHSPLSIFCRLSFFKQFLSQDTVTFSIVEQVVDRRKKWELLRKEYATKFPKMSMKLPKVSKEIDNSPNQLLCNVINIVFFSSQYFFPLPRMLHQCQITASILYHPGRSQRVVGRTQIKSQQIVIITAITSTTWDHLKAADDGARLMD